MCEVSRRSVLAGASLAAFTAASASPAAASGTPARTVAVRRRFFGAANVDAAGRVRPDRVILSWFGCTSFAAAIGGRVVLLDAWVPRGMYSGRVPTDVGELVALAPSHVFIGHGHFDHAADAAPIAAATGAVVVGTPEHCAQVRAQAGATPVRTRALPLRSVGDEAELFLGRLRVRALRHVHSAAKAPTGEDAPLLLPPDPTAILSNPPTLTDAVDTLGHQVDQEGGSVLYRFEVGGFSLVWNDTAGPLREEAPDVVAALAARPRPDVQVGAIQGFGQYTNGLRDPMDYIRAIRPRTFVPSHHDNWMPAVTPSADSYEPRLRSAIDALPAHRRPRLRFIRDTEDYVNPRRLTFAV